MSSYEISPN